MIGKPETLFIDIAFQRLALERKDVVLVGDNPKTDVKAGMNTGIRSALILTGVSTPKDLTHAALQPPWVVKSCAELEQLVFNLPPSPCSV